jgi:cell fate regulator YaaT (PSP1 superfamily)
MDLIYDIKVDSGARYLAKSTKDLKLKVKDWCVIRKEKVLDYGRIVRVLTHGVDVKSQKTEFPIIERKATVLDQSKANENHMRAKSAFRTAIQHIEQLKLPMKLLNCHYSYDGKLITYQFTAEGRVDFRDLVKNLSQSLNTRIELRQIGVRDETALCGGIGPCGQELCCSRFLREFSSINVKMAKEQDLSLNPINISGCCGRLKCCLKYEHEGYQELDQNMPRRGAECECSEGRGKIIDRNLLTRTVTVLVEGKEKPISCSRDDVRIVYPKKYNMPKHKKKPEETDEFEGLDADEVKLLKEMDENQ